MSPGRHLVTPLQADHGHFGCAFAFGGKGHIHRHVAAANDQHLFADGHLLAQGHVPKEIDPLEHAVGIFVLNAQPPAAVQSHRQKKRPESFLLQTLQGDIPAEGDTGPDGDSHLFDQGDFIGQHIPGQPVLRDAHGHHAARFGQFFENRHGIALQGQKIGGRQTGRPRTHNGNLLVAGRRGFRDGLRAGAFFPIGQEAVQLSNGQGLIHVIAGAVAFAGVVAHPAADTGKGVLLPEQIQGFAILALIDQGDVPLDGDVGRTGGFARGRSAFVDHIGDGHRLGKGAVDGPAVLQSDVPLAGPGDGTHLGALAAARAYPFGHVARVAMHGDRVIADIPRHIRDLAVGEQFDVFLLGHLHHLGGADAGGAVEGGEGLVKLEHVAADGGRFFHQVHPVARPSDVQGRLHTGDTGTQHHNVRVHRYLTGFQLLVEGHPVHGRGHQGLSLAGGLVRISRDPRHLLAHRRHLKQVGVDARPLAGALEGFFMQARRAGGHHHPVEAELPDIFFDHLLAGVRTHELVVPRHHHPLQVPSIGAHLVHPDPAGDVDAAVAHVTAHFDGHGTSFGEVVPIAVCLLRGICFFFI